MAGLETERFSEPTPEIDSRHISWADPKLADAMSELQKADVKVDSPWLAAAFLTRHDTRLLEFISDVLCVFICVFYKTFLFVDIFAILTSDGLISCGLMQQCAKPITRFLEMMPSSSLIPHLHSSPII